MTVFFSSHQIAEVEHIADRVAIIHRGRTVVSGELDDLRERFRRIQLVFEGDAPEPVFDAPGIQRVQRKGRVLSVLSSSGSDAILDEARRLSPVSIDVVAVTLKEIFLEIFTAEAGGSRRGTLHPVIACLEEPPDRRSGGNRDRGTAGDGAGVLAGAACAVSRRRAELQRRRRPLP